jgi:hypothetical protein
MCDCAEATVSGVTLYAAYSMKVVPTDKEGHCVYCGYFAPIKKVPDTWEPGKVLKKRNNKVIV